MTEANPPAQPNELCRRILFLLKEAQRRVDYPYLSDIAKDLGETPEDIKDQLDIMKDLGLAEVTFFIDEDAQPFITGTGKLKLEQWGQATPVTDSPPISETSSDSQEFQHSTDYASVTWGEQQYQFNKNQATCVRLLHEAWLKGTPYLSGHTLLSEIEGAIKMSGVFRRHPAWMRLIVLGERRGTYRLNLSPQIRPKYAPNTPQLPP